MLALCSRLVYFVHAAQAVFNDFDDTLQIVKFLENICNNSVMGFYLRHRYSCNISTHGSLF